MSDIIIREVDKDVWTFSRPFARWGFVPFGGRSTAIKLKSGNVWVMASTPLTTETKAKLDELGPVKYICGADVGHWLYLKEFKDGYPDAKLYSVDDAVKNKVDKSLKFDGVWGGENGPENFEEEILACYFSGYELKDVAFLHIPSKTLVEADLLFNLPGKEQYSNKGGKFPGISSLSPYGWFHQSFTKGQAKDQEAMKRDAKTVAGWDFNRIIPCHGDVIETEGNKAWKNVYKTFL